MHKFLESVFDSMARPPVDLSDDERKRCLRALNVLPNPTQSGLLAEPEIELDALGYKSLGYIDLVDTNTFTLYDYKTAKTLRYVKSEEELRSDPQVLCYGKWLLEHYDVDEVHFQWTYIQAEGEYNTVPVRFTMTRQEIEEGYDEHVVKVVAEMAVDFSCAVDEIRQNTDACNAFGGCPYYGKCFADRVASSGGGRFSGLNDLD
jgi:hypothetical protein